MSDSKKQEKKPPKKGHEKFEEKVKFDGDIDELTDIILRPPKKKSDKSD